MSELVPNADNEREVPLWVIVGAPWRDGQVAIYASTSLTRGELEMKADYDRSAWDVLAPVRLVSQTITMSLDMEDYVVVVAATYAEALQRLLRGWSPDRPSSSTPLAIAKGP